MFNCIIKFICLYEISVLSAGKLWVVSKFVYLQERPQYNNTICRQIITEFRQKQTFKNWIKWVNVAKELCVLDNVSRLSLWLMNIVKPVKFAKVIKILKSDFYNLKNNNVSFQHDPNYENNFITIWRYLACFFGRNLPWGIHITVAVCIHISMIEVVAWPLISFLVGKDCFYR